MNKKNDGFTLIELVVAVAIIGILSSLITPRVREQLAKARDTKAIALLSALRTAGELYYIEYGKPPLDDISMGGNPTNVKNAINNLKEFLDPKGEASIKDGKIEIGGSRGEVTVPGGVEADKKLNLGGDIGFTFINPDPTADNQGDGVYLWFSEDTGFEYDSSRKLWKEY
ncbi:pilin [Fusobacterium sp. PH5-44]|uniref:pilin n=1 Tax=unclassified Fusobacterium TaxID=2648384 RepID=UPI003D23649D